MGVLKIFGIEHGIFQYGEDINKASRFKQDLSSTIRSNNIKICGEECGPGNYIEEIIRINNERNETNQEVTILKEVVNNIEGVKHFFFDMPREQLFQHNVSTDVFGIAELSNWIKLCAKKNRQNYLGKRKRILVYKKKLQIGSHLKTMQ